MPDLVVTDIGMPGMNGLELIRILNESSGHPRFLILSCHDDFNFAQQAVQLGVQDYILKETLSVETTKEILKRIYKQIKVDDHQQKIVEKLHFQASQSKSVIKEKWLRDFLTTPLIDHKTWSLQLVEYGLNPDLGYYNPVVCSVYRFQDAIARYNNENMLKFIIDNAVEELLLPEPNVIYFSYTAKEFCLLFASRKDLKMNPYEGIDRLCKSLQQSLTKFLKLPVSILVGEIDSDCSRIKRQFRSLLHATENFFYSTKPEIIRSNQIQPFSNQEELLSYFSEYTERITRLILEEATEVQPTVNLFIEFITSQRFDPITVKQFLFKLALDVQMKLTFNQQYNNEKVQRLLEQMGNISELKEWMIQFLEEAISLMKTISKNSKKVEIIDAQKYIYLHLDRKIALEEVADHLFLNSSYFSRLFKKEMGENFIEYVTRLKMEKARGLLNNSNNTVEYIAQSLGYDNKSYFVKLFKKQYGAPPSRFV
jgi:two-component system response regulator YesN